MILSKSLQSYTTLLLFFGFLITIVQFSYSAVTYIFNDVLIIGWIFAFTHVLILCSAKCSMWMLHYHTPCLAYKYMNTICCVWNKILHNCASTLPFVIYLVFFIQKNMDKFRNAFLKCWLRPDKNMLLF